MSVGEFSIVSSDASTALVRLEGDFDEAGDLKDALTALVMRSRSVRLDMGGVSFFGSRGLDAVVGAHQLAHARGGGLRIVAASDRVVRLLELVDLENLLARVSGDGPSQPD